MKVKQKTKFLMKAKNRVMSSHNYNIIKQSREPVRGTLIQEELQSLGIEPVPNFNPHNWHMLPPLNNSCPPPLCPINI